MRRRLTIRLGVQGAERRPPDVRQTAALRAAETIGRPLGSEDFPAAIAAWPGRDAHGCAVLMFPPCAAAAARPELDNAQPSVAPKVDLSVTKHGVRVPR
jgi:hypothetical protein